MKKLFTLAAAVLLATGLWAAYTVPTSTLTLPNLPESGWAAKVTPAVIDTTNNWYILNPYEIYQSKFAWSSTPKGGSSSVTFAATDIFPSDDRWAPQDEDSKISIATVKGGDNDKPYYSYRVTNCEEVAIAGITGSDKKRTIILLVYELTDGVAAAAYTDSVTFEANSITAIHSKTLSAAKEYLVVVTQENKGSAGSSSGNSSYCAIAFKSGPTCEAPENELVLASDANETVYVGDKITFSTTGGNGGTITIAGANDETIADGAWTATVGKHTFTASQAKEGDYCAQESELVFNVLEKNPVTACAIEGPTSGTIGQELTYTATAANATEYAWFVDGENANTNAATFTYTGVKGDHVIYATATNEFTATPVKSNEIELTVTKLCGELIKAEYNSSSKTSTVTGVVGGTADRNTQDNGKLGSNGHYYGVKLTSGSFMAGDVVTVVASVLNGGNTATIYADKTGTTLLGSVAFDTESKTAVVTLTQSADVVYLYRKDNGCNPNIESLAVSRSCEDSNDATIHSLTVNGDVVEENEGLFEYTVSSSYEEPTVTIAFEIHPLATIKYGLSNPYELATPEVGSSRGQAFTIIAEDGTEKTYTVQIYKSASLSTDASLKELAVEGYALNPAFDAEVKAYTITKAYGAETPAASAVTATPNDANAEAEVVLAENVFTITVTAEDGETTEEYTITVLTADAPRALNEVRMTNGYLAYAPAGNPMNIYAFYLAGEELPTVKSTKVSDGASAVQDGDKLIVTGVDSKFDEYTLNIAAVTPLEFTAENITFDGTETWVKAANGFDASKGGWKFSKTDNDYSREKVGNTHVEMFLPACDTIVIAAGSQGTERDVKFYINGTQFGEKAKLAKAGNTLNVLQNAAFMLTIESAQTSGDGGVGAIRLAKKPTIPSAIDNTDAAVKAVKVIRDGQLIIEKNGKTYNALGQTIR